MKDTTRETLVRFDSSSNLSREELRRVCKFIFMHDLEDAKLVVMDVINDEIPISPCLRTRGAK